ncbi:protein CDI [Senna tora]|uniref:Protein CDI n=1 Tax=Senna tora TaxID=362788 RepID=A0A835C996_9FABA|nr:protein CDI [Senna tora]
MHVAACIRVSIVGGGSYPGLHCHRLISAVEELQLTDEEEVNGKSWASQRSVFYVSTKRSASVRMSSKPFKIFVGYDPREEDAYQVCRHSILKRSSIPVEIIPIKQADLREKGFYWRERGQLESTEFSFSRFLTPFLANYEGWAMFVDCDFLYLADIKELRDLIDDKYAVMCVQHDYAPKESTKMDGAVQTVYPRKNWSSMVLYNCAHPKNRVLNPDTVNTQTGAFLHRFQWLEDHEIGSVPFVWNFLEGHNKVDDKDPTTSPKAIHYTRGGPWFEAWKNCEFAQLWLDEKEDYDLQAKKVTN